LFQYPQPSDKEYELFYREQQRSSSAGFSDTEVPSSFIEKKKIEDDFKWQQIELLALPESLEGDRVFEIGAGAGTLLARFRDRGYCVKGVEPLELYANYAKDVLGLDVAAAFFDGFGDSEEYDLVVIDNVLEHMLCPFKTLVQIRKALKRNGFIYVAVPGVETPTAGDANIAHITLWTQRALFFALESAGFKVTSMVKGRPPSRPHEWVCLGQACMEIKDIREEKPVCLPVVPPEVVASRWNSRIEEYSAYHARRKKYGKPFDLLSRVVRLLKRNGLFPRDVTYFDRIT
jgi:SAM-dependent methyltransferase